MLRKTLIAAALAAATLSAGTATASAAPINNAIAIETVQSAGNGGLVHTAGFKKGWKFKRKFFFKKKFRGGYRNKCHWLKKKAYRTGSRYWWKQYRLCTFHYYR